MYNIQRPTCIVPGALLRSGTHDLLQRVVQFLLMVSVITLKCTFRFLMLQETTQADRNLEGMLEFFLVFELLLL